MQNLKILRLAEIKLQQAETRRNLAVEGKVETVEQRRAYNRELTKSQYARGSQAAQAAAWTASEWRVRHTDP